MTSSSSSSGGGSGGGGGHADYVQLPIKPVLADSRRSHDRDRFDFNDSDPSLTTDEECLRMRI